MILYLNHDLPAIRPPAEYSKTLDLFLYVEIAVVKNLWIGDTYNITSNTILKK